MQLFEMHDGTHIFAEQHGHGEPLLLIPGLGAGAWLWREIRGGLSPRFKLIMPELRGSGRSDKPDQRYSIALFADDMRQVLEQMGMQRAHILGVSMGGFVAQYLAAKWPELVASLLLVATSSGGDDQLGPSGEVLSRVIRPRGRTKKERLEDGYALNFTRSFMEAHPDKLDAITAWRTDHPQPEFAYYRQLLAGSSYDGARNARRIAAPTLICAGVDDALVPIQDVYSLQKRIPHAELLTFEGRHLFFYENSREFGKVLLDFLTSHAITPMVESGKPASFQSEVDEP